MIIRMRAHLSQDEQDLVARRVVETRKMIAAAKESDRLQDAAIRRRETRDRGNKRAAAFRERQSEMEFSAPIPACRPQGAPGAHKRPLGHPTTPQAARSGRVRGIVA